MGKNKFGYYFKNYLHLLIPRKIFRGRCRLILSHAQLQGQDGLMERVNYYNKLMPGTQLNNDIATTVGAYNYSHKLKTYFFDLIKYLRYFPENCRFHYLFGDVIDVPPIPAFVKSRPIGTENRNSVLLKLNEVRHFNFVNDRVSYIEKRDILFGRGRVFKRQKHRELFLEKYFNHPLCDIGKINDDGRNPQWLVSKASIRQHLKNKFILCLEGNDVATNLKWVMSSNSLAVMPIPKYETWFMEGALIPDVHYVAIKEDFSDLEEKLTYYMENTGEALKILDNAHRHVEQFLDKKQEELIALLTIQHYFERTLQSCQV